MGRNNRRFTVAAAQIAPVLLDTVATLDKALAAIAEAGQRGARLIAFPEVFLPGYPFWTLHLDPVSAKRFRVPFVQSAIRVDGPEVARLVAAADAAGVHVAMGLNERDGGTVYNSQLIVAPGRGVVGVRRKLMPTFHERMVWGWGDSRDLHTFDTDVGRLGALICFEHTHALYRYAMQAQGEQIHIAMWPGGIPDIAAMIDAAVRHHAFEGQCFVVNATAVNTPQNIAALGEGGSLASMVPGGGVSGIVDPRGRWIARADPDREEIVCAEVDFDLIDQQKVFVDSAGHYARPDVVRLVIEPPARPVCERRADHRADHDADRSADPAAPARTRDVPTDDLG